VWGLGILAAVSFLSMGHPEEVFAGLRPGGSAEFAASTDPDRLLAAGFTRVRQVGDRTVATRPAAPEGYLIRPMRDDDARRVLEIYQAGLDGGQASFEVTAPTWDAFDQAKLPRHRHVAVDEDGDPRGWIAVSPTSSRAVYAGVVEHSVYVDAASGGKGLGRALLDALIDSTEAAGIWTVQSGVFPENTPSLRLHERAGFRVIGTRSRVGRHHGRWRDVVLLERRSPRIN
jgi:L-amino acid N-acyltransferase YncA